MFIFKIQSNFQQFLFIHFLFSETHHIHDSHLTSVCIAFTVVGKRKFDGGHQNPGDPKRRYASGLILGNGSNTWGSQPLPQQPLGANGEQWYTDTYAAWS